MHACRLLLAFGVFAIWFASSGYRGVAAAQDERVWQVKGKLEGEDGKKSKNVSGIACTADTGFPRACLVVDDNLRRAQLVTVKDGEIVAGEPVPLIDKPPDGKSLELDGEGVAYADGFFYVIGSHGHPRDKEKKLDPDRDAAKIGARIAAASQLIRVRVSPATGAASKPAEVNSTSKLRELIIAQPELKPCVDKRLEANGVTIEGVAILNNRLFAGFRGPVVNGDRATVLSASLPSLFANESPRATLHLLPLGKGRGVRDLAAYRGGLLVLAGPVSDAGGGRYAIFWWAADRESPKLLGELTRYTEDGEELKPEALVPLDETSSGLRVLILFDGAKEGGPRAIEVKKPRSAAGASK